MSLFSLGDDGFDLWDTFSQWSKYNEKELAKKWASFASDREKRITLASLKHWAKENSPEDYEELYPRRKAFAPPEYDTKEPYYLMDLIIDMEQESFSGRGSRGIFNRKGIEMFKSCSNSR